MATRPTSSTGRARSASLDESRATRRQCADGSAGRDARWTGPHARRRGGSCPSKLRTGSPGEPTMVTCERSRARSLVKAVVTRALFWTRTDALLGALVDPARNTAVLGYHRVVDDFDAEAGRTI